MLAYCSLTDLLLIHKSILKEKLKWKIWKKDYYFFEVRFVPQSPFFLSISVLYPPFALSQPWFLFFFCLTFWDSSVAFSFFALYSSEVLVNVSSYYLKQIFPSSFHNIFFRRQITKRFESWNLLHSIASARVFQENIQMLQMIERTVECSASCEMSQEQIWSKMTILCLRITSMQITSDDPDYYG